MTAGASRAPSGLRLGRAPPLRLAEPRGPYEGPDVDAQFPRNRYEGRRGYVEGGALDVLHRAGVDAHALSKHGLRQPPLTLGSACSSEAPLTGHGTLANLCITTP